MNAEQRPGVLERLGQVYRRNPYGVGSLVIIAEAAVGAAAAKAVGAPVEVGAVIGGNAAVIEMGVGGIIFEAVKKIERKRKQ